MQSKFSSQRKPVTSFQESSPWEVEQNIIHLAMNCNMSTREAQLVSIRFHHVGDSTCMTDCSDHNYSTPEVNQMSTVSSIVCRVSKQNSTVWPRYWACKTFVSEYSKSSIPMCQSGAIQENRSFWVNAFPEYTVISIFRNTISGQKQIQIVFQL